MERDQQDRTDQSDPTAPPDQPFTGATPEQVVALFQELLGRAPNDQQEVDNWAHGIGARGIDAVRTELAKTTEAKNYAARQTKAPDPQTPNPLPPNPQTPDIYNAPLTKPFDGTFTPPTPTNIGGPAGVGVTPTFTPPPYTPPPAFKFNAPTPEEAFNDPGYKFRSDEGNRALQNWAAAKGTLNDSSTAKALTDYGQGAASQEYANVWNRNWQDQTTTYDKNYQTQYIDPYQIQFQGAQAALAPQLVGYQTNAAATQHGNDTNYLNSWNEFLNKQNQYNSWQDRTFNKVFTTANA